MSQTTYIVIVALSLLLILQGFLPFVSPRSFRRMIRMLASISDRTLHIIGFTSMLIGVVLLFITHHYFL